MSLGYVNLGASSFVLVILFALLSSVCIVINLTRFSGVFWNLPLPFCHIWFVFLHSFLLTVF